MLFRIFVAGTLLLFTQPAPPQPTFRSATELVEVDVRVVDREGRFVATLTSDDFELAEDGIARPIDVVYLVNGAAVSIVASRATPVPAATATPTAAAGRQTWIFVFDTPHLSPACLTRTRDAVRAFIKERFREGDLGGVVGDRGMVNNRLTSNREELERAVASVLMPRGRRTMQLELREWPRLRDELEVLQIENNDREVLKLAVVRACTDEPDLCQRGRGGMAQIETMVMEKARNSAREIRTATLQSVNILTALARGLARVAGPKTIVLISEGFVSEGMESHVQTVTGQAGVAGARIYTIDARGLARGGIAEIMDSRLADSPTGALGGGRDMYADGMSAVAIDTGGFVIRNENNFKRALQTIEQDAGTYYVLGYRPATATYDGKFHRIDVRVKQPGVKVRARRGYVAVAPARLLTAVPAAPAKAAEVSSGIAEPAIKSGLPPEGGSREASAGSAELPIARPPRTVVVPPDAIRKVIALARDADATTAAGNAADGWAAYQRGDVATAARELRAAVKRPDARPWMHYALGFAQLAQGQVKDAVEAWEQVRIAAPEFQETYFDLADAYLQMHDAAAALAVLREAEKRWAADSEVYNALGVVQISRGALDDAVETFEKAVKAAPNDSLGYFNLGRAYSMRFVKSQRFSSSTGTWVSNTRDRDLAVAQFEKYLALGGPYVQQAKEALATLSWR